DSIGNALKFFVSHYPLLDVARFGLVGVYLKLTSNWKGLEKVTANDWMQRYAGKRIYDAVWKPMLVGKFGEQNLDVVNMAWLWARIKSRTTRLGTFIGGFQRFMDKLADKTREQGTEIRLGCGVTGISRHANGKLTIESAEGNAEFDAVLSTSSPGLTAKLARDLPDEY